MICCDRVVACPECGHEQEQTDIPVSLSVIADRIYQCEGCGEHYHVGLRIEAHVSPLRGA